MDKRLFFAGFVLLIAIQWYVPLRSISSWEHVLKEGKAYKFAVRPVDPTDVLRGKYMQLSFLATRVRIDTSQHFGSDDDVYLTLGTDSAGFAIFTTASETPPAGVPFLEAEPLWSPDSVHLVVDLPFDTYYLEESKAIDAEFAYNDAARDTTQVAYAIVRILNGKSVLEDVIINEKPILEVVEEMRKKKQQQR